MRSDLFRPQVLTTQHDNIFGDPVFYQPFSLRVLVLAGVTFFVVLAGFAASASIKQTVSVRGFIHVANGEVKVYANRAGVIDQMFVSNGELVQHGQILAFASEPGHHITGDAVRQASILHTDQQIARVEDRLTLSEDRQRLAQEQAKRRQAALSEELQIRADDLRLSAEQLEMAEDDYARLVALQSRGAISDNELSQGKNVLINIRKSFQNVRIAQQSTRRLWQDSGHDAQLEQAAYKDEQLALRISLSQLRQRRQEMLFEQQFAVTAPVSGRVSNLLQSNGDQLDIRRPLVSIVAEKPVYEAQMYVPSGALGKLEQGQQVLLSYDAFPVQQYGTFEAVIESIATVAMDPREFLIPLEINEPVYQIKAKLAPQPGLALRAGMQFSAQLVTGERTLQQSIFEPLTAMARRL